MNFRLTGFLALATAFLALLILFWDQDDDTVRARLEQARRAFRFDPARVDRLLIESDDRTIECRLQDHQWHLVRPIAARADPVAIERLLGALQELPRGDIILPPRRVDDPYAPYGLDSPRARLSLIQGAVTNRILVGRRTPIGDGVYVRQSDHAGLARISTALLDLLPADPNALRDRSLLSGAPAAIERLDIRGPSGYLQLARDAQGTWRIFQPFTARVDPATVSALVETLLACSVVHFVQDAVSDLAPYGLDPQNAFTAVLNTDSGDASQMLAFGDPLPNDPSLVYARLQAENSIYAVPLSVRQALLVRPEDLRDRHIPGLDPDSIQGVRVQQGESVLEFSRDGDDHWQLLAPLRAPAEDEAILSLLRSWPAVRLTAFDPPLTTPPPMDRTLRIERRNSSEPPVLLHLGPNPKDPTSALIAIDGDSSTAVASPSTLLDFPLDPLAYRSKDILSIPEEDIVSLRIDSGPQTLQIVRDPSTGQWSPPSPWIGRLLAALSPLRAVSLLSAADAPPPSEAAFASPHLTLALTLRGQSGLATTLWVGPEQSPGGPRLASLRGRDLSFTLSPDTVQALLPPPAPEPP